MFLSAEKHCKTVGANKKERIRKKCLFSLWTVPLCHTDFVDRLLSQ